MRVKYRYTTSTMLIDFKTVCQMLNAHHIQVRGILHVGAHECEELDAYVANGVDRNSIVWIEGNEKIVERMKLRGIEKIYTGLVSDSEKDVFFNITNNGQSSSILPLETHKIHHPHVYVSEIKMLRTTTLKKLFAENQIDGVNYNFWNMDIQGAELLALRGADDLIHNADALYLEVNEEELYKGCALIGELDDYLTTKGFTRLYTVMTPYKWGDALYIRNNLNA